MLRLYWFNLRRTIRCKQEMFWALAFPLLLSTLFFLTFGTSTVGQKNPISTALVKEGNTYFESFVESLDGETLTLSVMEKTDALEALQDGNIEGIFYSSEEPSLTVSGVQMNESILQMLLDSYTQNQRMIQQIGAKNPLLVLNALNSVQSYQDAVGSISMSGNAVNDSLNYYFALIGMACLFGSFMGMTAAMDLRADRSALAARRSIVPTGRLKLVVSEMLAVFTVQFMNICVLLCYLHFVLGISFGEKWLFILPVCVLGSMTGVAYGICIGSIRLPESVKTGLLVGSSLFMSFLSGLMLGNMKNVIEKVCPLLNRLNPSSLISDAFYSISVYENMQRYWMNLGILAGMTAVLLLLGYLGIRRDRYDSL